MAKDYALKIHAVDSAAYEAEANITNYKQL